MSIVTLRVNGATHEVDIDLSTPLLYVLRNDLGLRGPRFGCGLAQCGACTVHLNGRAVRTCTLPVSAAVGADITTIEGLATNGELHAVQQAFHEQHALQCGFCTPGMILRAHRLLQENPNPSEEEIRFGIAGNLCRCTGYQNIVKAIQYAAAKIDGRTFKEAAE